MSEKTELCLKLLRAYETGDEALLREVYASDARIWHDFDGMASYENGHQSVDENVGTMHGLQFVTNTLKYNTLKLEQTETGFVEIHQLTGTSKFGKAFEALACLIGTVETGKITRLEEFINPASLAVLAE